MNSEESSRSAAAATAMPLPWHAELTAAHWKILLAAFLGWVFDGYET